MNNNRNREARKWTQELLSNTGLPRRCYVRIEPGAFGHHAILEGGSGQWAASKVDPIDALRELIGRHILGPVIVEAEAQGKHARVDMREVTEGLWLIECSAVDAPGTVGEVVTAEARGRSREDVAMTGVKVRGKLSARAKRAVARLTGN